MVIVKEFSLSYAHILPHHSGKCSKLHGHNCFLHVEVSSADAGSVANQTGTSSEGMVVDFGDLKTTVNRAVVDKWDHHFLAAGDEWVCKAAGAYNRQDDIVMVGVRSTAENLSKLAFELIQQELQFESQVRLTRVRWYETPSSYAEYTVADFEADSQGIVEAADARQH